VNTVYFATTNKAKFITLDKIMSKYRIKVRHVHMQLPEPRSDDVKEIAMEKVRYAFSVIKKPCIALDAGFYIPSLNGFPKAFVNFALDTIGIEGIMRLVGNKSRKCEFRHCIAYFDGRTSKPICFDQAAPGKLARSIKGRLKPFNWSKLSLVFIPQNFDKTLSQMSEKEYYGWRETSGVDDYERRFAEFLLKRRK
jgi:XTP/dITP diphosphohydrolase